MTTASIFFPTVASQLRLNPISMTTPSNLLHLNGGFPNVILKIPPIYSIWTWSSKLDAISFPSIPFSPLTINVFHVTFDDQVLILLQFEAILVFFYYL